MARRVGEEVGVLEGARTEEGRGKRTTAKEWKSGESRMGKEWE